MFNINHNQPMAKYLSWRSGGHAKIFYTPKNEAELSLFLQNNTLPILFLGLGSNLLIRSSGFDGVVIYTKQLNTLTYQDNKIIAASGVSLAKIARLSHQHIMYGWEFLHTIPATLGGALAMNAGCFNFEIWQLVTSVKTINKKGNINHRMETDFVTNYRQVKPRYPNEYFLSAQLKFSPHPIGVNSQDLLAKRRQSQPIGVSSCGSVFKNPVGYYAGQLISEAGLMDFCIGKACVSNKHANFIINTGSATPDDIENLIRYIQKTIKYKFNINLETEVIIW